MNRGTPAALLFALLLTTGCFSTPQSSELLAHPPPQLPQSASVDGVPNIPQKHLFCGPTSLAMALEWSGVNISPDELGKRTMLPERRGTLQLEMLAAARSQGRLAYVIDPKLEALLFEIAAHKPVIVLLDTAFLPFPSWHYSVVTAFDLSRDSILLHDGSEEEKWIDIRAFEVLWARSGYWGMLVLPPDVLPEHVERMRYLRAAAGLERAEHLPEATAAYRTALRQWPNDENALFGLGNTLVAAGKLHEAEIIYRTALALHPRSVPLLNNYSELLFRQGMKSEAIAIARKAVELGGAFSQNAQRTLNELEAR